MDLKEDCGIYSYISGAKYDGEWICNKMHWQSQYLYTNGDRFVGPYVSDKCMVNFTRRMKDA